MLEQLPRFRCVMSCWQQRPCSSLLWHLLSQFSCCCHQSSPLWRLISIRFGSKKVSGFRDSILTMCFQGRLQAGPTNIHIWAAHISIQCTPPGNVLYQILHFFFFHCYPIPSPGPIFQLLSCPDHNRKFYIKLGVEQNQKQRFLVNSRNYWIIPSLNLPEYLAKAQEPYSLSITNSMFD